MGASTCPRTTWLSTSPMPAVRQDQDRGAGRRRRLQRHLCPGCPRRQVPVALRHPRRSHMPTPAISQGRLFFVTGSGNAYALDAATGKQLWKTHLGGMVNMSSPMVADGRVFVVMSSPGHVFSLEAASGKVRWKSIIRAPTILASAMYPRWSRTASCRWMPWPMRKRRARKPPWIPGWWPSTPRAAGPCGSTTWAAGPSRPPSRAAYPWCTTASPTSAPR
ncbi:MAG: PQQ-binding-like beta-propeller repeat protein [Pseudomonadota bacterium]